MCFIACDDGYFGDCASMCHCRTEKCQKTTGICSNDQCDEGWMGNTCFQGNTFLFAINKTSVVTYIKDNVANYNYRVA